MSLLGYEVDRYICACIWYRMAFKVKDSSKKFNMLVSGMGVFISGIIILNTFPHLKEYIYRYLSRTGKSIFKDSIDAEEEDKLKLKHSQDINL